MRGEEYEVIEIGNTINKIDFMHCACVILSILSRDAADWKALLSCSYEYEYIQSDNNLPTLSFSLDLERVSTRLKTNFNRKFF